jgi:diamine N-acetyltransferase
MSKIYFENPSKDDLKYRQKWMMDPDTMSYNAGYDLDIKGYDRETGILSKTDEEMLEWYGKWINKEPDRYFRYIYAEGIEEPIGEIYYYPNDNTHHMGILIQSKYRGNGYSYEALMQLEKVAFEENDIDELHDEIPFDRVNAINLFKKAGFIQTDKDMMLTKDMYLNK